MNKELQAKVHIRDMRSVRGTSLETGTCIEFTSNSLIH